ncbi:AraC family transcriptional regulator [Acerihabitans sp.]|uniref:AraC family transcriptional regulator n=1 Tax=Acerihabitans sp. TaxID=2811394 RepID=UPI002ED865AE
MSDPFAQVVALLQPSTPYSKIASGAGRWRVQRSEPGRPFYCAVLEGACRLAADGNEPLILAEGDFVLIPAVHNFSTSSLLAAGPQDLVVAPTLLANGEFRLGNAHGPAEVRLLIGYCVFDSPDAALLVSLLPRLVHVRGEKRLATILQLVREEARSQRPARDIILARLLEVLFIEALRSTVGTSASPGLLRGLADDRVAGALRGMHETPSRPWTVAQLAKEASLSRSAFFERFHRALGVAPMEYLLAWRMALAKNFLRSGNLAMTEVAQRVGYSSASSFSVAFNRYAGLPPARYAREQGEGAE